MALWVMVPERLSAFIGGRDEGRIKEIAGTKRSV